MKILNGLRELIISPSGVFSLLCLMVLTVLAWKVPGLGSGPFIAFFGVVPALLAYCEHKEQLQVNAIAATAAAVTISPTPTDNIGNPRGQL
jgi:hypothetical protein